MGADVVWATEAVGEEYEVPVHSVFHPHRQPLHLVCPGRPVPKDVKYPLTLINATSIAKEGEVGAEESSFWLQLPSHLEKMDLG